MNGPYLLSIAAWVNFFLLIWLLILEVVPFDQGRVGAMLFFFFTAFTASVMTRGDEIRTRKRGGEL